MKVLEMTGTTLHPDAATPTIPALRVRPWADPVLDRLGHDPRDSYARFWLPLLGPSALLFSRLLAERFDESPAGFELDVEDAARSLGLGAPSGRRSAFHRTVSRLAQFRVVHLDTTDELLVRRRLPGLTRTQVMKLPSSVRLAHEDWRRAEQKVPALPVLRERSRRLALSLLELGESPEEVVGHLHRLRFHPSLTNEAMAWAVARHAGPIPR
jgi:hypothetical protein